MKVNRKRYTLNIHNPSMVVREGESPFALPKTLSVAELHETITMVDEHAQITFAPGSTSGGRLTPTGSYYDILWDPTERRELAAMLEEAKESRHHVLRTLCVKSLDGPDFMPFWIEYKVVPLHPSLFMVSRKDVTSVKIEDTIMHSRSQLLDSLFKHRPLEEALVQLINTIESIRPGMSCLISLFGNDTTRIESTISPSLPESFIQLMPKETADIVEASRQPVIYQGLDDQRWAFVSEHGFQATAIHGIFSQSDTMLGVFISCFHSSQAPSAIDIRLGEAVSELAGIAIALQREADDALFRTERSLSVTLDSINEGVIRTDEYGKIIQMNYAMANLLDLDVKNSSRPNSRNRSDSPSSISDDHRSKKLDALTMYIGKPATSVLKVIQVFYPDNPTFQELPQTPNDTDDSLGFQITSSPPNSSVQNLNLFTNTPNAIAPPNSSSRPISWSFDSRREQRDNRESPDSSSSSLGSSAGSSDITDRYRAYYADVDYMIKRAIESRTDVTLRHISDRVMAQPLESAEIHDHLRADIENILDDGDINMGYLYRSNSKTALLPVQVTVSPLRSSGLSARSETKGSVIVVRNISEVIKARLANRQLTNKSRWFSVLSHEMRTPVNGVIGMLELLRRTKLTPEQKNFVNCMEVSANALLCLVSNVLDKSRLDSGKVSLEHVSFGIKDRLKSFSDLMTMMAKNRKVNFTSEIDEDIPDILYSDVNRLFQILLNLVSNAIKFSGGRKHQEGKVNLRVSLLQQTSDDIGLWPEESYNNPLPESPGGSPSSIISFEHLNPFEAVSQSPSPSPLKNVQLLFEVFDNGIGINQENILKLFKEFGQAEASTSRRYGGSGMGLYICKQLVELFGGQIGCESEPGKGSRFYFTGWFRDGGALELPSADTSPMVTDSNGFFAAESQQILGSLTHSVPVSPAATDIEVSDDRCSDSESEERRKASLSLLGYSTDGRRKVLKDEIHILIADDDVINQQVLAKFLEGFGFKHIDIAGNGLQALEKAKKTNYTFILMDLFMPIMDGLETAEKIIDHHTHLVASRDANSNLPERPIILAITGDVEINADRYRLAGMVGHLTKPIRMKQLLAQLEKYVEFVEN